ncbi:MAG: hypothetical protein JRC53_03965 [Deltaproteobacteria bacterium]|nr:hypothetical protein [Deltaproteobacteria bacterium]
MLAKLKHKLVNWLLKDTHIERLEIGEHTVSIDSNNITLPGTVDGVDLSAHAANASAHHTKTTDAGDITSGTFAEARIPAHMAKSKLAWTADKLLKGAGAGADPTEIDVPGGIPDATAGDLLQVKSDAETTEASASYVKHKEIVIGRTGTYRVKFDLKTSQSGYRVYGRIYRNGVAVGTEQSTTSDSYVTMSEDISGWSAGDLLQLYLKAHDAGPAPTVRNLRVYAGESIQHTVVRET